MNFYQSSIFPYILLCIIQVLTYRSSLLSLLLNDSCYDWHITFILVSICCCTWCLRYIRWLCCTWCLRYIRWLCYTWCLRYAWCLCCHRCLGYSRCVRWHSRYFCYRWYLCCSRSFCCFCNCRICLFYNDWNATFLHSLDSYCQLCLACFLSGDNKLFLTYFDGCDLFVCHFCFDFLLTGIFHFDRCFLLNLYHHLFFAKFYFGCCRCTCHSCSREWHHTKHHCSR